MDAPARSRDEPLLCAQQPCDQEQPAVCVRSPQPTGASLRLEGTEPDYGLRPESEHQGLPHSSISSDADSRSDGDLKGNHTAIFGRLSGPFPLGGREAPGDRDPAPENVHFIRSSGPVNGKTPPLATALGVRQALMVSGADVLALTPPPGGESTGIGAAQNRWHENPLFGQNTPR